MSYVEQLEEVRDTLRLSYAAANRTRLAQEEFILTQEKVRQQYARDYEQALLRQVALMTERDALRKWIGSCWAVFGMYQETAETQKHEIRELRQQAWDGWQRAQDW